jgi:hypothetical protein
VKALISSLMILMQSGCAYSPIAYYGIGTTRESPFIEKHVASNSPAVSGYSCRAYGEFMGYPKDYANAHEAMVNATDNDIKNDPELFYKLELSYAFYLPVVFALSCYEAEGIPVNLH